MRIATPDLVTNSYFPALAAEELGLYREEGFDAHVELLRLGAGPASPPDLEPVPVWPAGQQPPAASDTP